MVFVEVILGQYLNKTSLLIVEDDVDIRSLLNHFLKDFVDEITLAENGKEALEALKKKEFDAILSDIEMPSMDGIKFLAYTRSLGHMTPFIVLTAHGNYSKALEALSLGAFDFLSKDAKRKQMTESVSSAIRIGKSLRSSKHHHEQGRNFLKIYKDMARESKSRLIKIIEGLRS